MDSSEIQVNNSEGTLSEEEDDLDNESTSSNTMKSSPGGSVDSSGTRGYSISATSGKVLYFPKPEILPNKVRIFRCPEDGCNKTFSKSSNLTQHLRIHSGEKPFECKSCGRMFRQSGNLTKHMKSHENTLLRWNRKTNMKPFKCSFIGCEKSFTAKSSLQNHLKTHPPTDIDGANASPVIYKCNHKDCTLTFSSEAELYMHLSIEPTRTELEREIVFLKNTLSTIFDVLGNPDQQLSNSEIIHEIKKIYNSQENQKILQYINKDESAGNKRVYDEFGTFDDELDVDSILKLETIFGGESSFCLPANAGPRKKSRPEGL